MSRSEWKKGVFSKKFYKNLIFFKEFRMKTKSRSLNIFPILINKMVNIYNGKFFVKKKITSPMKKFKLGSFVPTKQLAKHKVKNKARG